MAKPETSLDWTQFEQANAVLADSICRSSQEIDLVLAINRGGAISGVCISHLLGISNMLTFTVQTLESDEPNAGRKTTDIAGSAIFAELRGKHVLLVDDAVGSGITLLEAKKALAYVPLASLTTAATVWNTENHDLCPADHHGCITPGWVLFPWEIAARNYKLVNSRSMR